MTYTSGYQSPGSAQTSAYSPFNRAGQQPPVQQPGQYAGYPQAVPGDNPFPNSPSSLGADTYLPPANPGDIDALSGNIDSKIADIRRAFNSQPAPPAAQPGAQPPLQPGAAPVSQADMQWAMELENKVKTQNYQPNAQETARYEQIFAALQAAQQAVQTGGAPPAAPAAPTAGAPAAPAVPDADISWALDLEKKVNDGYQPTAEETARYNNIFARLNNQAPAAQPGTTQPAAPPVSQEDMEWAMALENKVKTQNYQPNAQETARYEQIFAALKAAQEAGQPQANPTAAPPSQPTNWNQWAQPFSPPAAPTMPLPIAGPGGQPMINVPSSLRGAPQTPPAAVLNQAPGQPPAANGQFAPAAGAAPGQGEIDWALQLEARVQQGYQPNAQETAQYQDIARRLQAAKQAGAQPQMAPQGAPPAGTSQAPPAGAPQLPPGVSQQDIQWAMQLEAAVQQGQQPSPQDLARYQAIEQKLVAAQQGGQPPAPAPQQQPPAQVQQPPAAPPAASGVPQSLPNGLTQQEVQWAMNLEAQVQQGYQPSQAEIQQHASIAQRLQAPPQAAPAPQQGLPFQPQAGGVQQVVPQGPQAVQIMPQSYPQVQGQTPQMVVPYNPANNQIPLPPGPQQGYSQQPGMPPGGPPPAAGQQSPGLMTRLGNAWNALWE